MALRYALDHPDRISALIYVSGTELRQTWREAELVAECQALRVPVLIIDGAEDLRPRWAVNSLEQALPRVTRVVLPGVGHMPWLEAPGEVSVLILEHLREIRTPI